MMKPILRLGPGMALSILALAALAACNQPEVKDEIKNPGKSDLKTLSSQLNQPYLINEQGEIISEIPPVILQKMKDDLKFQAKMAEWSELEKMYDPETGKLRDIDKLGEIQNRLDMLAAGKTLPVMERRNP